MPDLETELAAIRDLNCFCREQLAGIPSVTVNSPDDALPYILNFSAGGVRAETMLHFLSEKRIFVSSGSACSRGRASHVLKAMGLPQSRIRSALRLSFCRYNTKEEAARFFAALREGLSSLAAQQTRGGRR